MKLQLILFTALAVALLGRSSGQKYGRLKLLRCALYTPTHLAYIHYVCNNEENAGPNVTLRGCSFTLTPYSWWKAFTGIPSVFNKVEIFSRHEKSTRELVNFNISVDDRVCYTHNGRSFSHKSFDCNALGIALKISTNGSMPLCDVKVFGSYKGKKIGLRKCKQSSDIDSGVGTCEKAIDGNLNQVFYPGFHCSHTGGEATGWWKAETEGLAWIDYVQIYNRRDCCADRLTNFTISVNDKVCYRHDGTTFSEKMFKCSNYGRVLKIESGKPDLTLCEVIATGNYIYGHLTLLGCAQKRTRLIKLSCEFAYDESPNPNIARSTCSTVTPTAAWKVFTGVPSIFYKVAIHTRQRFPTEKPVIFTISVDDRVCYTHDGRTFSDETFDCNKLGIALKISSDGFMALCDVKVFGWHRGMKLSVGTCKQSSVIDSGVGTCEKAIDGNLNQVFYPGFHCSHTGGEATGWWKVHIFKPSWIEYVQIYNRQDCCADRLTNFTISVNDDVCYTHNGATFSEMMFFCSKTGTDLKIESRKPYLTLCEVIATGKYID